MSKTEERRALVGRLMAEGHKTPRSVAKTLKDKHGIEVHRSTVARDMERLQGTENTPLERHEDRVRKLTEMLDDKDLSRREKLAVHRTLNETEGKLHALQAMEKKVEEPGQSEEANRKRRAGLLQVFKESAEKRQRELKEEMRAEVYAELREKGVKIEV
jgi:vacuolar-type H+-ATPase subunit I/STV1